MESADITYFFQNFCKTNVIAFNNGKQHVVRQDCRFLDELGRALPNGFQMSSYTQIMTQDIEWTSPMNHQYAINGLTNYFSGAYEIFKIIKHVLTSGQFITQEHHDTMIALTKGSLANQTIYTFLINGQLAAIYAEWKANKTYCKDGSMIHNKIAELYANNIPLNFPNIQQISNNETMLEPTNSWRTLIKGTIVSDDFQIHMKIWKFLNDYMVMIRGYATATKIEPLPVKEKKKKKKPETETLVDEKEKEKSTETKSVSVEEKKKKKTIPVALKRKVWAKWMGEDIGKAKCLRCKLTDITQLNFHCGHIIAEAAGGELKVDNLKPICQSCNSSMGTINMDEFITKYGF